MSPKAARLCWGVLLGGCLLSLGLLSMGQAQNEDPKTVAELLPQESIVLVKCDGSELHEEAFAKTAAHKALFESGLVPLLQRTITEMLAQSPAGPVATEGPVGEFIGHLTKHGIALSVSVSPPQPGGPPMPLPQAILVVPDGAKFAEPLGGLLQGTAGVPVETREVSGVVVQTFIVPDTPGVEVGWWADGGHLVISGGINSIASHVAISNGEAPNLTTSPLWEQFSPESVDFEMTTVAWFDVGAVRDMFAPMPIPLPPTGDDGAPVTVGDVAKILGLDNLGAIISQSGYNGPAMWSENIVQVDGEMRGLLALGDHEPIKLDQLPPLPADTKAFAAFSFSPSKFWNDLIAVVKDGVKLAPPPASEQVDQLLANLPQMLNFDIEKELFDTLGNVTTIYLDSSQDILGFTGMAKVVEVKDAATLRKTIDHILLMAEGMADGKFKSRRTEKHGREILTFQIENMEIGGLVIDDNWMAVSLLPQTVEAFLMRVDEKLPRWEPTREVDAALAALPDEFTTLTVSDPRATYRFVMTLAPFLFSGMKAGLEEAGLSEQIEVPISLADLPPTAAITQHLFPNVTMTVKDDRGFHSISRSSLPAVPFEGGGAMGGVATTGVLVALALPAVQQARMAARRTQSRNNLRQIALSLHNYHDVNRSLPSGTVVDSAEEVSDRLSWVSSVLPYLDQAALYQNIDQGSGWNSDDNSPFTAVNIQTLINPAVVTTGEGLTNYVGIAGLGEDAPTLPVDHERAGVFGYERQTRFRDITDGTSNTIGVTEATGNYGRWAAGGSATIRSVTQEPYINGPDGIGGPFPGGVQVMLMDGSVRFVSENIDPEVFKAMITIRGGEVIPPF